MTITNHWLNTGIDGENIRIDPSANKRPVIDPDYLIIHYTASDDAQSCINWFKNTHSNTDAIAAHVVIDFDGHITQLIPFNCRANHAGSSTWNETDNMNFHSIGIELVNPGWVQALADGSFRRPLSATKFKSYPASVKLKLLNRKHKNKLSAQDPAALHWFKYPSAQLNALYELSRLLVHSYQLVQVLGHDDISPLRKTDPGPAFDWDLFKTAVYGKTDDIGKIFLVNTGGANFRTAPSTNHSSIIKKLPLNYEVGLIETVGLWCKVYLASQKNELLEGQRCIKKTGWIHKSLLTPKTLAAIDHLRSTSGTGQVKKPKQPSAPRKKINK